MSDDDPLEDLTPYQRRVKERQRLRKALHNFRRNKLTPEEIVAAMTGVGEQPDWVKEVLHLLDRAHRCTLDDVCEIVGVNRKALMAGRRKYPHLEAACKDFLAGTFEGEMEYPSRGIRPNILTLAADRIIPTFAKNADGTLSEEDVALLVRAILDSLRSRVAASGLDAEDQAEILQGVAADIRHEFEKRKTE